MARKTSLKKPAKPNRRTTTSMQSDILRLDGVIADLQFQLKNLEQKNIELNADIRKLKSRSYTLETDLKNSESIRERLMNTIGLHVHWISRFHAYLRKSGKKKELRDLAKQLLNQDNPTFSQP